MNFDKMLNGMPHHAKNKVDATLENIGMVAHMKNPKVALSMLPSATRGMIMKKGKKQPHVKMHSGHAVHFDFEYHTDFPEMYDLYRRAVANQWDAEWALDWDTQVDPQNPETPVLNQEFIPYGLLEDYGIKLNEKEKRKLSHDWSAWVLSQFMHGEQGALYASAQVTEAVQWVDGKLYGATQVMDEGRHLECFLRYLETKLEKIYHVNDNLFVILDDLMTDSRWDVKFLGMQIMVEGLALGAFGTIYNNTREPLLKEMLKYVIQDEARHVHYGVLALREHITKELSDKERREREDWAFEVAILMRNRFLGHEIYEEWFEHKMRRRDWNEMMLNSPNLAKFRTTMFKRLVPNLKFIGLLSDRMRERYAEAGMLQFEDMKNASQLTAEDLTAPDEDAIVTAADHNTKNAENVAA